MQTLQIYIHKHRIALRMLQIIIHTYLADPGYMAWLKINHPELASASGNFSTSNYAEIATCRSKSPDVLRQLLVLPEP